MKRIVLALGILALASVTVPGLKEKTQPHVDRLGLFLGEHLEGPLSPVLNPYRRLRTETDIGKAVRELIQDRNQGFVRPNPDDFREYMQTRVEGEDGLDHWGTPYILLPQGDTISILSAGPDLQYETDDDIVVDVRFGNPGYLPRRRF